MPRPLPVHLVRVRYLTSHADAHHRMGGNPDRVLGLSGLPADVRRAPESLIPKQRFHDYLERAIRDTGPELWQYAAPRELGELGSFGARLGEAPSLHTAIAAFLRLVKSETAGTEFFTERRPGTLWWHRAPFGYGSEMLDSHAERYVLQIMLSITRHWTGTNWLPDELCLMSGPTDEDEALRPIPRVRYRCPTLAFPIPCQYLGRHLPMRSASRPTSDDLDLDVLGPVDVLDHVLETMLPLGVPTLDDASELLGTSSRSLQRRLYEEGTSFSAVMAKSRKRLAISRLLDSDALVTDIAHDLGYSDSAHFARAFRRWVGHSPERFRRLQQDATQPPGRTPRRKK